MSNRTRQIVVTYRFNDGEERYFGPLTAKDAGILVRMAYRQKKALNLIGHGWAEYKTWLSDMRLNNPEHYAKVMSNPEGNL